MTYCFSLDSTVEDNLHRLLHGQLAGAIASLGEGLPANPEVAIHDVRKRLKKARALLRLVRPALEPADYAAANDRLRQLGQWLAPARDGVVYQATLAKVLSHSDSPFDPSAFAELQTYLTDRYLGQLERLESGDRPLSALVAELKDAQAELCQRPLDTTGWAAIAQGLKRIYRQGRSRFQATYPSGDAETFHDWRKRVKDLRYDLHLLRPLWPPVCKAFEGEANRLATLLGDDHDLAALGQFFDSQVLPVDEMTLAALRPVLVLRQQVLRQQAQCLGQNLYSETPAAFARRFGTYWQTQLS